MHREGCRMRLTRNRLRIKGFAPCLVVLFLVAIASGPEARAAAVKTRLGGANNWNTAATWIQIRTGTLATTKNSTAVTGTGTFFTTELAVGDLLIDQIDIETVLGTV